MSQALKMPQPRLPLMKLKGSLVYAFAAGPPAPEPRRPGFLLIDGEKSQLHSLTGDRGVVSAAKQNLPQDSLACGADWLGLNASQQPLRRSAQRLG